MANQQSDSQIKNKDSSYSPEFLDLSKMPGGAIRDIASGLLQLVRNLNNDIRIRTVILDANVILRDIAHISKRRQETRLFGEAEFGLVRLLATPRVVEEVGRYIPFVAKKTKNDVAFMFEVWSCYKERLTIVTPEEISSSRITQLNLRDPDDVGTAQLIELVGPTLALSADNDLKDLGYSQKGDWLPCVLNTKSIVDHDALQVVIKLGGSLIVVGLSKGLRFVSKTLLNSIKRIPTQFLGLAGLTIASLLLDSRFRAWICNNFKNIIKLGERSLPQLSEKVNCFCEELMQIKAKSLKAEKFITGEAPQFSPPTTLKGYLIRVLAFSPNALTPQQLMDRVKQEGYQPRGINPEKYLETILRKNPIFCSNEHGHWQIGGGV
jgi:hypothetical protein